MTAKEEFIDIFNKHYEPLLKNITVEQLSAQINEYLKLYGMNGEKWSEGRRSHQSYINALRQFRKFILVKRFAA